MDSSVNQLKSEESPQIVNFPKTVGAELGDVVIAQSTGLPLISLNGNNTARFSSIAVGEGVGLKLGKGVGVIVGVFEGCGVMVKASVRVAVGVKVGV